MVRLPAYRKSPNRKRVEARLERRESEFTAERKLAEMSRAHADETKLLRDEITALSCENRRLRAEIAVLSRR